MKWRAVITLKEYRHSDLIEKLAGVASTDRTDYLIELANQVTGLKKEIERLSSTSVMGKTTAERMPKVDAQDELELKAPKIKKMDTGLQMSKEQIAAAFAPARRG